MTEDIDLKNVMNKVLGGACFTSLVRSFLGKNRNCFAWWRDWFGSSGLDNSHALIKFALLCPSKAIVTILWVEILGNLIESYVVGKRRGEIRSNQLTSSQV